MVFPGFKHLPFLFKKGHGTKRFGLGFPFTQWPRRGKNGHGIALLEVSTIRFGLYVLCILGWSGGIKSDPKFVPCLVLEPSEV